MIHGHKRWRVLGAVLIVAASTTTSAQCPKECDDVTAWTRFTTIDLTLTSPAKTQEVQKFHVEIDPSTIDLRVDVDARSGKEVNQGSIGMIEGRTMIARGLKLERGYEIDALDGPVLSTRLLLALLNRAAPGGPDSLKESQDIDLSELQHGIQFATPSAEGHISAPWRVVGTIGKPTRDAVTYDLHLTGGTRDPLGRTGAAVDLVFTGRLGVGTQPVFQDSMSLAGWQVFGVGPKVTKQGGSTIIDYGASEKAAPVEGNVADVRAALKEEFSPGKPDPTKDFTGYWKEKCDQDFGLKIIHYGNEGKYAVLFCGPGGCDDPAHARLTFITGDKGYEVLGDDVLLTGRSSDKSKNIRCSRDVGEIRPVSPR